jgi:hypothetical protein
VAEHLQVGKSQGMEEIRGYIGGNHASFSPDLRA